MKKVLLAVFLLASSPALALDPPPPPPQQPDPALMERVLGSMQAQRNQALDAQAVAEGRVAILTNDLAKANARIKDLEQKVGAEPTK